MADDRNESRDLGPIVSSSHLASEHGGKLSEFEFGLITASHAFQRWMVRCMAAAGHADFSPLDVLVLHGVNHRDRAKRLADICLVLNVEDTHLVNYALKKLHKAGLVAREKRGKEIFHSTTEDGQAACQRYREIRERCLVVSYRSMSREGAELATTAELLRALSGLYDQAARAAASL